MCVGGGGERVVHALSRRRLELDVGCVCHCVYRNVSVEYRMDCLEGLVYGR